MAQNLIEYDPPKMLSLREVRVAGATANRLLNLRHSLRNLKGGSLTIQTHNGSQSLSLSLVDLQALIGLLIERDEAFLTGLNVETTE